MAGIHKYFPTGNVAVGYSGGSVATSGLSSAGLSADDKAELDKLVLAGVLRTDLPGRGALAADTILAQGFIPVIGTASTDEVIVPEAATLVEVYGVSNAAGATADCTVSVKNLTQPNTCCTVIFPTAYAGHVKVDNTAISHADFAAGDVLSFDCDGGGAGTGSATLTAVFQRP
jgi:hypothetical protein